MDAAIVKIGETITGKITPIEVKIPAEDTTYLKYFKKKGKDKVINLTIEPSYNGTLLQISDILNSFDKAFMQSFIRKAKDIDALDPKEMLEESLLLISKYGNAVVRILALAFHNKPGEPDKELTELIKWRFTPSDTFLIFNIIIGKLDVSPFTMSIISTKALNIVQTEMNRPNAGD